MTPARYHHEAARTRPNRSRADLITMAALGIGGEASEVLDSMRSNPANTTEHRIKELGDVCWYVATLADALGMDPETLWTTTAPGQFLTWYEAAIRVAIDAGAVVEAAKKHLFHSKSDGAIRLSLCLLAGTMAASATVLDTTISEVWAVNVAKLRERHPDGFKPGYSSENP